MLISIRTLILQQKHNNFLDVCVSVCAYLKACVNVLSLPTLLVSWVSIMKLWTCLSARDSSSLRFTTATNNAVHPAP